MVDIARSRMAARPFQDVEVSDSATGRTAGFVRKNLPVAAENRKRITHGRSRLADHVGGMNAAQARKMIGDSRKLGGFIAFALCHPRRWDIWCVGLEHQRLQRQTDGKTMQTVRPGKCHGATETEA